MATQLAAGAVPLSSASDATSGDRARWQARVAVVGIHASAIVAMLLLRLAFDATAFLIASGVVMLLALPICGWLEARRAVLVLTPLSFILCWMSMGLGMSAIYEGIMLGRGERFKFALTFIAPDDVATGYMLFCVGAFFTHLGIQLTRPPQSTDPGPKNLRLGWCIFLWLFGAILRFLPGTPAILTQFTWGTLAVLCTFALTARDNSARTWLLLILGTIVEFAFETRTGSKAYMMFALLPLLWRLMLTPKTRLLLPFAATAAAVFYVFILQPVVGTARRESDDSLKTGATEAIVDTYTSGSYRGAHTTDEYLREFFRRHFESEGPAYIYREVEQHGYLGIDGIDYVLPALVPRVLWPDKPIVSRGAWFTYYLGEAYDPSEATTSTAQTWAGELYWCFGVPGIALGLLVIGAGFGLLWRITGDRPDAHPLAMTLYIVIIMATINQAEAGTIFVAIVSMSIIPGIPILLLRRQERHRWLGS